MPNCPVHFGAFGSWIENFPFEFFSFCFLDFFVALDVFNQNCLTFHGNYESHGNSLINKTKPNRCENMKIPFDTLFHSQQFFTLYFCFLRLSFRCFLQTTNSIWLREFHTHFRCFLCILTVNCEIRLLSLELVFMSFVLCLSFFSLFLSWKCRCVDPWFNGNTHIYSLVLWIVSK